MEISNRLKLFEEYIMNKYNSKNTASSYCGAVGVFLKHFLDRIDHNHINSDEIIRYLLSIPNLHSRRNAHSAIKLFYKHKSKNGFSNKFRFIPYPEKPHTLPTPITKEEFIAIIQATENLKHKCILMLGFDCGFRVSEVCNLKPEHIDFHKMQIRVIQSKGRKDRVLKMSSILASFLNQYFQEYGTHKYVFKGQFDDRYSERSCEQILKNSAIKAGITRRVTFHQNRHGFAVSHLDNNTELERLKEMLGHKSIETTRIYAPLSNKEIQKDQSPLEQILSQFPKALQNNTNFIPQNLNG